MSKQTQTSQRYNRDDNITVYTKNNLKATKTRVKKIARDLLYPNIVMRRIDEAKTANEIDSIMARARRGEFDHYSVK